jgi:hypothetical protein
MVRWGGEEGRGGGEIEVVGEMVIGGNSKIRRAGDINEKKKIKGGNTYHEY